ncbi:MAG: MarR family winged helix-turn-helix transcriptional regulator [Caulobacter sp.]
MFSALALIGANPGLSQKTLAREVGFDKATIVAILDNMERQGWTERRRSSTDRRRHLLFVTAAGAKALEAMTVLARENEAHINAALTKSEQATLQTLLDKVYKICFVDVSA